MAKSPYATEPPGPPSPLSGREGPYNYGPRPRRDVFWGLLFAAFWVVCIVLGIFAVSHSNTAFFNTDYDSPDSCPVKGRNLLSKEHEKADLGPFVKEAAVWLAGTLVGALLFGVAFLKLFQHHSHTMTRATIGFQIALPLAMAIGFLANGMALPAVVFIGMAGLTALLFGWWRDQIALASRLLGISAHGLAANPGLIGASILLNLGAQLAVVPLLVLSGFAYTNGEVVPNPARQGAATCEDVHGQLVQCCSWEPNSFAKAYIALAGVAMLWTMLLANQIRVFVVSGTIAQWYFSSVGLETTSGALSRSLGHAFGPSFGSLSLSGLILTITNMIRQQLEQAQEQNSDNVFKLCLGLLAQWLMQLVEYLTKFATVLMAITGDSFFAAGREVTDLLARNLLDTFASTVWFTPMVIQMAVFVMSTAWGLLVGFGYWLLHRGSALDSSPGVHAGVLGGTTFVLTLFILGFLGGVLLSVLDSAFVCWAIDKDRQTVSNVMVFEVFQTVPVPGAAVEQPGGELNYGAPQPAYQAPNIQPHV